MHHKYAVVDGEAVWTGSTNWTDDSWTREENVVVMARSTGLARAYTRDFDDLWSTGEVGSSGHFDPSMTGIDGAAVQPWFSPGKGKALARRIAHAIATAKRRVRVCSPVITAGLIVRPLADVVRARSVDVAGVCDGTQMREVLGQWRTNPASAWKIPVLGAIFADAPFGSKRSTPYGPGTIHDYMHAKVTVVDDVVFVGSYNLSGAGQENAENVLEIHDPVLADRLAGFIDGLRTRYPDPPAWPA